jgi:hypothetical protein
MRQLKVLAGEIKQPLAGARLDLLVGQLLEPAGLFAVTLGPASPRPNDALTLGGR